MALTLTSNPNPNYTYPSQGCCLSYTWDDPDAIIAGTKLTGLLHFKWEEIEDGDYFYANGTRLTYKDVVTDPTTEIQRDLTVPTNATNMQVNTMATLTANIADFTYFPNGGRILLLADYVGAKWNTVFDVSPMYERWDFTSVLASIPGTDTRLKTDYSVEFDLALGGCNLGTYRVFPKLTLDSCSQDDELNQNYSLSMYFDISELIESSRKVYVDYLEDQVFPEAIPQENYIGEVDLQYRSYYVDDSDNSRVYGSYAQAPSYYVGYGLCSESGDYLDVADQLIDGDSVAAKWLTRSSEIVICGASRTKACLYLPDTTDYGIEVDGFTVGCSDPAPVASVDFNCTAHTVHTGSWISVLPTFILNLDLTISSAQVTQSPHSGSPTVWNVAFIKTPSGSDYQYTGTAIQSYGEEDFDITIVGSSGCATYEVKLGFDINPVGGPYEPTCGSIRTEYITVTDISPVGNYWAPDVSTDLDEKLHCFDLTYLANNIGSGAAATFTIVKDVNTSPVAVSEPLVITRSDSINCCCAETFHYLSDIGSYLPLTLTCELTHNIELSGPSYVPCSDCHPQDTNHAHLVGPKTERYHYNTSYLVKNKYTTIPTKADQETILRYEDFLSSNDIRNAAGERVYIKRNERSIKRESGLIRMNLTIYKALRHRSLNRY